MAKLLSGSFLDGFSSRRQTVVYVGDDPEIALLQSNKPSSSQPPLAKRTSGAEAWWRQCVPKPSPSPSPPRSLAEWKATLGSIKREYMSRRYRQCAQRCQEILENTAQLAAAHPVHVVYLRFYAATSLEMQGRACHHSSPHHASLLRQAYEHYAAALELADAADAAAPQRPGSSESLDDFSSAASDDLSSAASPASTRMSSPAPTVASSPPRKKKVAFRDDPVVEPIIRPDSPTLGFDEWLGRSSPEPLHPEPILKKTRELQPLLVPEPEPEPQPVPEPEPDLDPFFHARSVHRYCAILASIRRQISAHMTTLDIEIATCAVPTASVASSPELRSLDLRARIERLRAVSWKRPRFDAHRYQQLREEALADMLL